MRLINSIDMSTGHSRQRLCAELPSGNGYTNGRGIALACAIIANGGLADGKRLLSPAMVALAGQEQAYGRDPYLGMLRLGLGFGLDSAEFPAPTPTSMHWGGYGGSGGVMDPSSGISMGYAPNNWVVPQVPDGQLALDGRMAQLCAAFAVVSSAL